MAKAGLARVGRGLGWRSLVAGSALALAGAVAVAAAPSAGAAGAGAGAAGNSAAAGAGAAGALPASGSACGKAVGPFSVSGTWVLRADGEPFISYGLTVPGLQRPDWGGSVALDRVKIAATAEDWCANTVRLQLNQDDLLGPAGTGFNQAYMTAIKSEVALAERYQLVVVLNDETNFSPAANRELGPTPGTERFWRDLAQVYGHDPQVIFDLFNEPRMYSVGMSQAQKWHLWLDGGTFGGVRYSFGMAQLAAYVRNALGVRNLFWIEGPESSASFAGMVQQHAVLNVSGVVYALHHPAGQADTASWDADFGYLVTTGVAPVVDGEWTNYEPAPTAYPTAPRTSCWPGAPNEVPQFLQYLAEYGIGMNAYQLQPGYLIRSYSNLAGPTTMNAKTWTCQSNQETQPGQGAGSQVLAWFRKQNG
jgi:Cellulase (glycosyl hydrolase family 5)